jgi:hypothetical protein
MKQGLHLVFCRLATAAAASWGGALLLWPALSSGLPAGELPPLHARCIGIVHLALACGLWSAWRRLDAAAARLPLLLLSTWGAAAVATALITEPTGTGRAWLVCMAVATGCAVWLLLHDEAVSAPAERLDVAWASLAVGAAALGAAQLLWPGVAAAFWPWPMEAAHAAAYGAPLLGFATMAWAAARERRRYAREPAVHACLALATGLLAASLLHRALFSATRIGSWVWFGLLISLAGWAAAHSAARRLRLP